MTKRQTNQAIKWFILLVVAFSIMWCVVTMVTALTATGKSIAKCSVLTVSSNYDLVENTNCK